MKLAGVLLRFVTTVLICSLLWVVMVVALPTDAAVCATFLIPVGAIAFWVIRSVRSENQDAEQHCQYRCNQDCSDAVVGLL